jgi:excisionase family DNA binding protein
MSLLIQPACLRLLGPWEVRLLYGNPFPSPSRQDANGLLATSSYVTPDQAASELGVTRRTVYNWMRSGILPAKQIGRTWRIKRDDLE